MQKIYVERITRVDDNFWFTIREEVPTIRDGLLLIYKLIAEGWHWAADQQSTMIHADFGILNRNPDISNWMYPHGCTVENDFGEAMSMWINMYPCPMPEKEMVHHA